MISKKLEVRAEALSLAQWIHGGFSGFKGGFFSPKNDDFWDFLRFHTSFPVPPAGNGNEK